MGAHESLTAYLKSVSDTPFRWGTHDCLIFSNAAFRAFHGHGWSEDWLGRYMRDGRPLSRAALRKEYGWETLEAAVDARLRRITTFPPAGALVTTRAVQQGSFYLGQAFGIATGRHAAFVGGDGVLYLPVDTIHRAWIPA